MANGAEPIRMWSVASVAASIIVPCVVGIFWAATIAGEVAGLKSDNEALQQRSDRLTSQIEQYDLQLAKLEEHQVEIETQLRASDIVRNMNHAYDLRIQSMLWTKAGLPHFPTDNGFYPEIATPAETAQSER